MRFGRTLKICFGTLLGVVCSSLLLVDLQTHSEMWAARFRSNALKDPSLRPWFMKGGQRRPVAASTDWWGRRVAQLWPHEKPGSSRISQQLMFIPPTGTFYSSKKSPPQVKKIFVYNYQASQKWTLGREAFRSPPCPVDTCSYETDIRNASDADAVLFFNNLPSTEKPWPRPANQVWILFLSESPFHTPSMRFGKDQFNWTVTYRWDSDAVSPYYFWQYYDRSIKHQPQSINFAANKTKKVAWFVSNCNERNKRREYATQLAKHIQVDIFGACGTKKCPRSSTNSCFEMLRNEYKFYLSFENSNCVDYITEKFFINGLANNVIPIVMGARPEDYERSAPFKSYIHVDEFASPKELAAYLHLLDADDQLYNEYFQWKGTGEMIYPQYGGCEICALLHDPEMPRKNYADVSQWWGGPGICVPSSWRHHNSTSPSNQHAFLSVK